MYLSQSREERQQQNVFVHILCGLCESIKYRTIQLMLE